MVAIPLHILAWIFILCLVTSSIDFSGKGTLDSTQMDFNRVLSLSLDGRIRDVLKILRRLNESQLMPHEVQFKTEFEKRSASSEDSGAYLTNRKSPIDEVLRIYRDYWRLSLLNESHNYDSLLANQLATSLQNKRVLKRNFSTLSTVIAWTGNLRIISTILDSTQRDMETPAS